jgi:tetratricopeptide (TPR) repeat protein
LNEQAHQVFELIRQQHPDDPAVQAYFESHQAESQRDAQEGSRPRADDSLLGSRGLDELADVLNRSGASVGAEGDESAASSALADMFPGVFRGAQPSAQEAEAGDGKAEERSQPSSGPDPHFSLGLAYKEMGLYAEARKEIEQTLALPAYAINASLMIAECHKAEGHPELGVQQLQRCLESLGEGDEPWIKVAFALGVYHADAGQLDEAVARMERILSVQTGFTPAEKLLGELRQRVGAAVEVSGAKKEHGSGKTETEGRPDSTKTSEKRRRISYV